MKKNLFTSLSILLFTSYMLCIPDSIIAQINAELHINELLQTGHPEQAYTFSKEQLNKLNSNDSAYLDMVVIHYMTTLYYEQYLQMQEDFNKGLEVNKELLDIISKHKESFNKNFSNLKYFIYRNQIVCYTGLGQYTKAQKYRQLLYNAQKKGKLPCEYELCHYFNFDFFKVDTLNVWGYEWYDKLPKNRFSSSFTKIVYYIYNTDSNGNDNDQLYRLHVLMFHGNTPKYDYIMDKRISTENGEISGSMYKYTYKENIDFEKLHNDVIEIIKENEQADTQRFIPQ